jgi:hypothetical protein
MVTEMSCGQFIGCNNSFICAKINSEHLIESTHFKVRKSSHLGSKRPSLGIFYFYAILSLINFLTSFTKWSNCPSLGIFYFSLILKRVQSKHITLAKGWYTQLYIAFNFH